MHLVAKFYSIDLIGLGRFLAVLPWPAQSVWQALLYTAAFGLLGIVLTLLGFKAFDWITPKIDVETELAEKHNIAVAIVVAAIIIGISIVVVAAMIG